MQFLLYLMCMYTFLIPIHGFKKLYFKDYMSRIINRFAAGCPTKHDNWRKVLNVFFHMLYCIDNKDFMFTILFGIIQLI